jgi:hypothetical protein
MSAKEVKVGRRGTAWVATVIHRENSLVQKEKRRMKMKVFASLIAAIFCMAGIGMAQEKQEEEEVMTGVGMG